MRRTDSALLLSLLVCGSCGFRRAEPAPAGAVRNQVQTFARSVAEGVTRDGPAAWAKYFDNSPSFFMAVDGRLKYADGAAAQSAIPELVRTIQKIELHWGDGLRIDPVS